MTTHPFQLRTKLRWIALFRELKLSFVCLLGGLHHSCTPVDSYYTWTDIAIGRVLAFNVQRLIYSKSVNTKEVAALRKTHTPIRHLLLNLLQQLAVSAFSPWDPCALRKRHQATLKNETGFGQLLFLEER